MKGTLDISPALALPLDFATQGVAVIGMRGAGKTTTEVDWCEELYDAGIPFVVIEPKGDWGGIRSSADGKSPGLSVPIFGGRTGDAPLTANLGPRIADMLVDLNISAVLDLSNLSVADKIHFITEFCNRLMFRHQREPHVRCVVLEEAHRYIPQQVKGELAACKEAASAVLLEGRAWGLGCWACTQRPARLHKDLLEEVGTAICHRLGVAATNDLRTVQNWMKNEGLPLDARESLTKLANGEAWVLAPVALGIAERVQMRPRRTFDGGATPLVGAASRPTVTMAQIDMAGINTALAEVIEKAKAEDPRTLKQRITELERQLKKGDPGLVKRVEELERELAKERRKPAMPPITNKVTITKQVEVAYLPDGVKDISERLNTAAAELKDAATQLDKLMRRPLPKPKTTTTTDKSTEPGTSTSSHTTKLVAVPRTQPARREPVAPNPDLDHLDPIVRGSMAQRIMAGLLEKPDADRKLLAMLCECHPSGKSFANTLSAMRSGGYLEGLRLTDAGVALAGELGVEAPGDAWEHWYHHRKVSNMGRTILDIARKAWETGDSGPMRDELAETLGHHPSGKSYANTMSTLRSLGLIETWPLRLTAHFAEAAGL